MHGMFRRPIVSGAGCSSPSPAYLSSAPRLHTQTFFRKDRYVSSSPILRVALADLIGRMLAKKLGEQWKQTAVVDNRAGGAGVIGTDLVAKATPNGYTLLVSAPGPITTGTLLQEKLPYDPVKDLTPITLLAFTPSVPARGSDGAVEIGG